MNNKKSADASFTMTPMKAFKYFSNKFFTSMTFITLIVTAILALSITIVVFRATQPDKKEITDILHYIMLGFVQFIPLLFVYLIINSDLLVHIKTVPEHKSMYEYSAFFVIYLLCVSTTVFSVTYFLITNNEVTGSVWSYLAPGLSISMAVFSLVILFLFRFKIRDFKNNYTLSDNNNNTQ